MAYPFKKSQMYTDKFSPRESHDEATDGLLEDVHIQDFESRPVKRTNLRISWIVHGILLLLNVAVLLAPLGINIKLSCEPTYKDISKSPAAEAIHLEEKFFMDHGGEFSVTPYIGKPTNALIRNWTELRKYGDIAVSEEFMESLGRTDNGIKLPDGSGYLATIQVYHDLHCIEQAHRWMYRDQYYPGMSDAEYEDQFQHIEHCLETLRQSLMCNADMSIITMRWGHAQATPLANWTFPHTCKSWDAIDSWAKEHYVERLFEPGWLVHPTLGPAYANASRLGVAHDD